MKTNKPTKIGRPLKLDSGTFKQQVNDYLADCKATNKLPTLTGLSLKLGVFDLTEYGKKPLFASDIKRLKYEAELWLTDRLSSTDKPLINHIFLAKAIAGLRDNSNLDITSNGQSLGVVVLPKRGR